MTCWQRSAQQKSVEGSTLLRFRASQQTEQKPTAKYGVKVPSLKQPQGRAEPDLSKLRPMGHIQHTNLFIPGR